MTGPAAPVAVVLPCRDARHLLWRSLASVAAQSLPAAQIVIFDQGSGDGLGDWLRVHWPGVELRSAPPDCDDPELGGALAAAVTAPHVAVLRPGERWPPDHLATVAEAPEQAAEKGFLLATADLGTLPAAAALVAPPIELPPPSPDALAAAAVAALPSSAEAVLLDLRAAGRPGGLLDLLGLAAAVGPSGFRLTAATLADEVWPLLDATPRAAPLLVSLTPPLGLRRASEQLSVEELLRRAADRPFRLVLGGIGPSSAHLTSRLLDAVLSHPDLELWLADQVSARLATSLVGRDRVRLVPPPVLALHPILREVTDRSLLQPGALTKGPLGQDLEGRMSDHGRWWAGLDAEVAHRLALALARVLGHWRWLRGPLLQQAWSSALAGWAVARLHDGPICTAELQVALFAAVCGRPVELAAGDPKEADVAATWRRALESLGVRMV